MADEKRQGLENVILYRICMFLWNMMKPVQNPRYAPLPGFSPSPDTPAKPHKTRLRAGGQAAVTAPATGKSVSADAMEQKNDTKSTRLFNIRVYARHQMEPHACQAAEGRLLALSEIRPAAEDLPDSGRSGRWRTPVGEKRHQICKCMCPKELRATPNGACT
jgi:hypothetical protein